MSVEFRIGKKFPGDEIIDFNGKQFYLYDFAVASIAFVENEEKRKKYDPKVKHWKEPPADYFLRFMVEAIESRDAKATCKKFNLKTGCGSNTIPVRSNQDKPVP